MDNVGLLPRICRAGLASHTSMAPAGGGDRDRDRGLRWNLDHGHFGVYSPGLAAGSSDSAGLLASWSVRSTFESGFPKEIAGMGSEAAFGLWPSFNEYSGTQTFRSRPRICISTLLSARAVWPGCAVFNGYGPLCGGVLEYCHPACVSVLCDVPVRSNASTPSDRKRSSMATSTVETPHAESLSSSPCHHSSEHVSKRTRGSKPCDSARAYAFGAGGWRDFSLLCDRHCRRRIHRPIPLRRRCIAGSGARGDFVRDGAFF